MREPMQTDVFSWHGWTAMPLGADGDAPWVSWVKATPAFRIELGQRFGFPPLELDGVEREGRAFGDPVDFDRDLDAELGRER